MAMFDNPMGDIDWSQLLPQAAPTFAERFQGGGPPPTMPPAPSLGSNVGPGPMDSPISPEAFARNAAARGVPPPPADLAPPMRMPPPEAVDAWRGSVDATMGGKPGEVGAALTGKTVGAPMDITSEAQKAGTGATEMSAQAKPPGQLDKFAEALKGAKMPENPALQRLSTPNAPRPTTQIKGGELMALLQMLGGQAGGTDYKLPSTLGAALRK